jgi:hypothetical protein
MVAMLQTPSPMRIASAVHSAVNTRPPVRYAWPSSALPVEKAGEGGAERRVFPRKEISARIEGKRVDHSLPALRQPHLTLSLRDLSLGGLSAISPAPLERGERLTVTFPPQGLSDGSLRGGWDAVGRVLRCDPSALGYRIAVEFDHLPAAA